MLTIPYTEKPQFNFDDVVNYYYQQAIIKGMAYTSFSFCDDVPCWYYLIQSINDNSWFQAWLIEEELIMHQPNFDKFYRVFDASQQKYIISRIEQTNLDLDHLPQSNQLDLVTDRPCII